MRTGADNVGGVMGAQGVTPFEQAVAAAMTSVFGVGASSFHVGGVEGPAPSVYLGAFRRSTLEAVGGYDESFIRAQDWEMNHRIRARGGLIWFTPRMHVTYRPRPNVRALSRQYRHYGRWRREVMRHHPETARSLGALRYFTPPLVTLGVILGVMAGAAGLALDNTDLLAALAADYREYEKLGRELAEGQGMLKDAASDPELRELAAADRTAAAIAGLLLCTGRIYGPLGLVWYGFTWFVEKLFIIR